jgi:hypothetical protein
MGTEKIKKCGLSCHKNMKFLHDMAEVSCAQKWNTYMYLDFPPQNRMK